MHEMETLTVPSTARETWTTIPIKNISDFFINYHKPWGILDAGKKIRYLDDRERKSSQPNCHKTPFTVLLK